MAECHHCAWYFIFRSVQVDVRGLNGRNCELQIARLGDQIDPEGSYHKVVVDCFVDWLVDWLIGWLTDWLVAWLIGWLIDWGIRLTRRVPTTRYWLIVLLIGWLIGWLTDCLVVWLIGWLTVDWLTNWLVDRLIAWLINWLIGWRVDWQVKNDVVLEMLKKKDLYSPA